MTTHEGSDSESTVSPQGLVLPEILMLNSSILDRPPV